MMIFSSECSYRIQTFAIVWWGRGEYLLYCFEHFSLHFEVPMFSEMAIPRLNLIMIVSAHIEKHSLEIRTFRDIHARSIGDDNRVLIIFSRWFISPSREESMEHIVLIGCDMDLLYRESHLHRIVSGECISEIPWRYREDDFLTVLYFFHFEEFRIRTEIIDCLCQYTSDIDRIEGSDMIFFFEFSILWTIYFLDDILERIEWCICKKGKCIGIVDNTIHRLEPLYRRWSSRREHEEGVNIRSLDSTMGCIDRVSTWCSEDVYLLAFREYREEAREELEGYILECEGRPIAKMQRIEILSDMFHRCDVIMVPLATICGIDDRAEMFLGHSKVPSTEYGSGNILIPPMAETLDILRRKMRKHGRTPETRRMWLTREYGILEWACLGTSRIKKRSIYLHIRREKWK